MSLIFSSALWMAIWGGMFTGYYNLPNLSSTNPFEFFQGFRALLPLFSLYVCLVWLFKERTRFPFFKDPLGFLFLYSIVGITTSLLLSPAMGQSMYWAGAYLSPLFMMWVVLRDQDAKLLLRFICYINYGVFFMLTFLLLPEAIKIFRGQAGFSAFYNLPLGFGGVTKNGVGRYAMIVIIVAAMRFLSETRRRRYVWLSIVFPGLFLLMQTQSRTALLGLAVCSALYMIMKRINWRYFLASPIVIFILWFSGYRMRAHGRLDALIDLSGREATWGRAFQLIGQSPFLGWGFDADRIMMNQEHIHNSYIHASIQVGIIGALLFFAALVSIWLLVLKTRLLEHTRDIKGEDQTVLMESILIVAFLTSRSFFESTAAFYGVDLLLIVPAMAFISLYAYESRLAESVLAEVT
ncbi:MAG: O-antigen ligase family protein [Candidatus Aminicenantes bacterium]|nr:O-antigen ligase family protein [Candidatus Aminicenantes bacterium]